MRNNPLQYCSHHKGKRILVISRRNCFQPSCLCNCYFCFFLLQGWYNCTSQDQKVFDVPSTCLLIYHYRGHTKDGYYFSLNIEAKEGIGTDSSSVESWVSNSAINESSLASGTASVDFSNFLSILTLRLRSHCHGRACSTGCPWMAQPLFLTTDTLDRDSMSLCHDFWMGHSRCLRKFVHIN